MPISNNENVIASNFLWYELFKIVKIDFKNKLCNLFFKDNAFNCLQNKAPYIFHMTNQKEMNQSYNYGSLLKTIYIFLNWSSCHFYMSST